MRAKNLESFIQWESIVYYKTQQNITFGSVAVKRPNETHFQHAIKINPSMEFVEKISSIGTGPTHQFIDASRMKWQIFRHVVHLLIAEHWSNEDKHHKFLNHEKFEILWDFVKKSFSSFHHLMNLMNSSVKFISWFKSIIADY